MTIEEFVRNANIDRIDAEVLLGFTFKKDRSWVVAHPEYSLTPEQESQLKTMLKRRRAGESVAYIVGEKEFYGRRFNVDPRVLIPRPSTEGLVELVLENVKCKMPARPDRSDGKDKKLQVRKIDTGIVGVFFRLQTTHYQRATTLVDIGTGSGCIAITLACELPNFSLSRGERGRNYLTPSPWAQSPQGGGEISNVRIIATDISPDALEVARENAKRHGVSDRIEFRDGSLLEPIKDLKEPFFVVSNPPYVAEEKFYEPPLALFAGPKGTDVLIPLIEQAKAHPYCMGIFVECQEGQVEYLCYDPINEASTRFGSSLRSDRCSMGR